MHTDRHKGNYVSKRIVSIARRLALPTKLCLHNGRTRVPGVCFAKFSQTRVSSATRSMPLGRARPRARRQSTVHGVQRCRHRYSAKNERETDDADAARVEKRRRNDWEKRRQYALSRAPCVCVCVCIVCGAYERREGRGRATMKSPAASATHVYAQP